MFRELCHCGLYSL